MLGKTISHYRILEKLGEGGMGVVYKAEDIKLKRLVALKFLPSHLTTDASIRKRFIVEAQAASALDHPNICNIHEINETPDGQLYICMAYYEGESLRNKIKKGPIQVKEAVKIFMQIAQGLKRAHEEKIIHRDIKPGNIIVTERGEVKIVDFGLAKLVGVDLTKSTSSQGTAAYMSPEQIRGGKVDHRSDIWAMGIVFYEMLTAHRPFKGNYPEPMMYSIVNEEPLPLSRYLKNVPERLQAVIDKLLKKNPAERYQNIAQLFVDLNALIKKDGLAGIKTSYSPHTEQKFPEHKRIHVKQKKKRLVVTTVILSLLIGFVLTMLRFKSSYNEKESEVAITTSYVGTEDYPALSPDGSKLAFSWNGENEDDFDIYVKLIGENDCHRITSSIDLEYAPAWSTDGNRIAYVRWGDKQAGIYIKSILGGREKKLHPLDRTFGAPYTVVDWSPDGQWIVFDDFDVKQKKRLIFQLNVETLEKEQLTFPGQYDIGDMLARYSPDGTTIGFTRVFSHNVSDLYLLELNNSKVRRLTTSGKHIKNLAWAPNGREIIFCSNRDCLYRLWRISISGGEPERLNLGARDINWISVSRSSNRLAYSESVKNAYIYTAEIFKQARAEIKPRLFNPSTRTENFPAYSPDEERIAFASARTGCMEIWTCKRDGSDLVSLTSLNSLSGAPQWSPDGQWIVFDSRPLGNSDILIVDANGVQPPRHLTTHPSEDGMPTWSHDGQWIYFGSNRTGDWRIHKIHLESGDVIQVTQNESYFGFESPDKKWFYFKKKYENWGPVYKFNLKTHEQSIAVQDSTGVFAWAIATESIVYITFDSDGNQILKRYNTLSEKAERLGKFVQDMKINLSISDVSNDGHALLMWGNFVTSRSSDIFLVENFE